MQAVKIRDYRKIFRELGMSDFELFRALVRLRSGEFPRYILETVLRNDVPDIRSGFFSTEYADVFIESVRIGLVRDRVDSLVVMADAVNYADGQGLDSEKLFLGDGFGSALSQVFWSYFRIKHKRDIDER